MQTVLGRFHIQSVSPPPSYQGSTSEEKEQISQTPEKSKTLQTPKKPVQVYSHRKEETRLSISLAHNQRKSWVKTFLIQVTNI